MTGGHFSNMGEDSNVDCKQLITEKGVIWCMGRAGMPNSPKAWRMEHSPKK